MNLLETALASIKPVDAGLLADAQHKLDNKTKPPGSLGKLEEFGRRVAAIRGTLSPELGRKVIFTFAGDHGVVEEGVSLYPKEVTSQMVFNFLNGGAGVNVLARHAGAEVRVVDMGVDFTFGEVPGLINRKVAFGTANLAKGPAMSRSQALQGVEAGIALALAARDEGVTMLGTGDMGIGNTTPSSAIAAVFTGKSVRELTHRGTGIGDQALERKVGVIEMGLALNRPDKADPMDVLAKVGGFEIAGIAGLVLGSAAAGLPVVVDGFISTAGALIASELHPNVRDYIFAAHKSVEIGHKCMMERIGTEPILDLNLRLGEGTGAALAMTLIEAGVKVLNEMASFEEAGVTGEPV